MDSARLKYEIGNHLDVDTRSVHAFIIGEHGDSELAVWSSANVSGIDLDEYLRISGTDVSKENFYNLYDQVKNAAYKIIDGKGATYYAIAMSACRIVKAITRNEHSVLTVSSLVNGHYGINDVCMGIPCIVGKNGVEKILDIPLSESETIYLSKSAETLGSIIRNLKI